MGPGPNHFERARELASHFEHGESHMHVPDSSRSTEFSFLAWLEGLSMFAVALGIVVSTFLGGDDDSFVVEGGSAYE